MVFIEFNRLKNRPCDVGTKLRGFW